MTFVAISPSSGKVTLYNMDNSIEDLTLDKAAQSRGGYITGRISSLSKIKNASKDISSKPLFHNQVSQMLDSNSIVETLSSIDACIIDSHQLTS